MYIVIGANGYVGSYMIKNILENTTDDILAIGRHISVNENRNSRIKCMQCDITKDKDIVMFSDVVNKLENVKVIYLAAYHHPDQVKDNPKIAWNVNITSLSKILNILDDLKCLFYVSTEMVYGEGSIGKKFTEKDSLNPVNLYGIQKKVAEELVLGYGYNVVRFPFIIGPSLIPEKKHFYDIIVDTIMQGKSIEMFENTYKSALDFDTASKLVIRLVEIYSEKMPKILNVSGDEILSKYDIGIKIARANGADESLIKPIRLEEDTIIFDEKRASCTLLDNELLKSVLHINQIRMKI